MSSWEAGTSKPEAGNLKKFLSAVKATGPEQHQAWLLLRATPGQEMLGTAIPAYTTSSSLVLAGLRLGRRMSQGELADLLGVSRKTVGRWESGEHGISSEHLQELARVLRLEEYEHDMLASGSCVQPVDLRSLAASRTTPDIEHLFGKPLTETAYFELLPVWEVASVRAVMEETWRPVASTIAVRAMQSILYSPMVGHMKAWSSVLRSYWGWLDPNDVAYGCGVGLADYAFCHELGHDDPIRTARLAAKRQVPFVKMNYNLHVDGIGWLMMRTAVHLAVLGEESDAWSLFRENLRRQEPEYNEDFESHMWKAVIHSSLGQHGAVLDMAEGDLLFRVDGLDDAIRLPVLAARSAMNLGLHSQYEDWIKFGQERLSEIEMATVPEPFREWARTQIESIRRGVQTFEQ